MIKVFTKSRTIPSYAREEWYRAFEICSRINMRTIALALKIYYQDYRDFPSTLEILYPNYIANMKIFRCPLDPIPNRISYLYTKPNKDSSENMVVLSCERHFIYDSKILKKTKKKEYYGIDIVILKNFKTKFIYKNPHETFLKNLTEK